MLHSAPVRQGGWQLGGPGLADAEYILPLKWNDSGDVFSLSGYLEELSRWISVLVVDGSPPGQFALHEQVFPASVRHCRPLPLGCANGKVEGVLTGLQLTESEYLVIADDDVRYTRDSLERVVELLAEADAVRPQNYFMDPKPWHARWDTARSLINRAFGSDYPGTLAVRRSTLQATGGYSGNVLFENLELLRTIRAAGGREIRADDLFVPRISCSASHFRKQRIRQAYDDFAQPARLAAEAALLPVLLLLLRKPARLLLAVAVSIAAAEAGRRRADGTRVFAADAALWAPLWLSERAVGIWVALGWRLRGGIPYAGNRLLTAAHSVRRLRKML